MIYILGGANMDIYGSSFGSINSRDSNIGRVSTVHGGVARNVCESLARLTAPVSFMSAFGNDSFGKELREKLEMLSVDLSHSLIVENEKTATYLAIIDGDGDMNVAICDNTIVNHLNEENIRPFLSRINEDDILVMDTNLSEELITFVLKNAKTKIYIDPLSIKKAEKIKDYLENIYVCKPNIYEAEVIVNHPITNEEELCKAGDYMTSKGVNHVFISLGDKGIYYQHGDSRHLISTPRQPMINATGAGDACMAGIIYAHHKGLNEKETVELAMSNAVLALQAETTVNQNLNEVLLNETRNKLVFEWRKM